MPSCWLGWANHTQEFILSTIGVMQKRVESSEADLFVETNSACVEGGYAQAPHPDGKVCLTKGQTCREERSSQAFAGQIRSQTESHLDRLAIWLEDKQADEFVLLIENGVIGLLPAPGIKQFR